MSETFLIADEAGMIAYGREFAGRLGPGDVVALSGDLGAGKTHFCKGVVAGLGCGDDVTSPTFSLVREYRGGRLPVFHFDFYRLDSPAEVLAIDWEEYVENDGILLVEWAEKFLDLLPEGTIRIRIGIRDDGGRELVVT